MSDAMSKSAMCVNSGEVASLQKDRASFYRMLASLFYRPLTQEEIDSMASSNLSSFESVEGVEGTLMGEGIHEINRSLKRKNTGTRQELAADFTSVFGGIGTWNNQCAAPYKSVFTSEEGLLYQEGYREVFAEYKRHCVRLREGVDLPDDHLSFICEFMALMADRAATAMESGKQDEAASLLFDSCSFLREHILSWFPRLYARANHIAETHFYRGVLKLARGYFENDLKTLECLLAE